MLSAFLRTLIYHIVWYRKDLCIYRTAHWTFFASSHGWGTMSGYWSKSLCSKGDRSLWAQISGAMGRRPLTTVGAENWSPWTITLFAWSYIQPFWHNTRVWRTDRRTDGHTMTANTCDMHSDALVKIPVWKKYSFFLSNSFSRILWISVYSGEHRPGV